MNSEEYISDDIVDGLYDRCYPITDLIYDAYSMRVEFNRDQIKQLIKRIDHELDDVDQLVTNNLLRIIQDSTMSYKEKKYHRDLVYRNT